MTNDNTKKPDGLPKTNATKWLKKHAMQDGLTSRDIQRNVFDAIYDLDQRLSALETKQEDLECEYKPSEPTFNGVTLVPNPDFEVGRREIIDGNLHMSYEEFSDLMQKVNSSRP